MEPAVDTYSSLEAKCCNPFIHRPHKMVKHTLTIRWQQPIIFLSVLDDIVRLVLKRLEMSKFYRKNP